MKENIKKIVKRFKFIYFLYDFFLSNLIKFLGLFISVNDNMILFSSFGGKKYDDSPKAIFEYMRKDPRCKDFKFIWAFSDVNISIPNAKVIKIDTLNYYIIALKSKYWVTNSAIERGLHFKKKENIYLNTWHGSPIKNMGADIPKGSASFRSKINCTIMLAQSNYEAKIFSRVFEIPFDRFLICGLPRNDELAYENKERINNIKKKLGIQENKKIILYAPTFREYLREGLHCFIKPPINFDKWKLTLGDNYIFIFRAHYEISKIMNIENSDFVIDLSSYHNLNELMLISDILISDYSSIFFDYSILKKPMLCFAYDYEEYSKKRGLYLDIKNELPNGICKTEDELLQQINSIDFEIEKKKTENFCNKYVEKYGNATEAAVEKLLNMGGSN